MNNEFEYKEEYQYLTSAMLNVTDDCNLQCRYCFVEQHPHYMTLDTAKAAVDWLYKNYLKKKELNIPTINNKISLYFFGGEPMLCYETIIKPIVQYCEEQYKDLFQFGMTTNGTLLSKEKIDWLQHYNFSLLLSIDGNKETQDFNRPCRNCTMSSFDLIEKNIPYLLEKFPNLTFRSTGYAPTIHHMFENYLYAESLGFKRWLTICDNRNKWTQQQINNFKEELSKIYFYRLEQIGKGIEPMICSRIDNWFNYTIMLLNNHNFENLSIQRCGLATTNGAIGYDGSIYGCQEQVSKDNKNLFYIGNIFKKGINKDLHFKLLKTYYDNQKNTILKKEECEKCSLKNFCINNTLYCPSTTFDLFNNFNQITEISCFVKQYCYKNSILFLTILSNIDQNELNKYLQRGVKENGLLWSRNNK